MEQYIPKSALVAEIERRLKLVIGMSKSGVGFTKNNPVLEFAISEYKDFLSFIDSLEVKEVDLEKNSLTWKDINLIDHLLFDIKEDYDNGKLDKEKYYKEVLKKFKAQL